METSSDRLEAHSRSVVALAEAESPTDVFRILLEASGQGAPKTAVFLVRHGSIKGWAARGYPPETGKRVNGLEVDRSSWLGRTLDDLSAAPVRLAPDDSLPDFGQPPADDAVALPVRVAGRAVAVLLAESEIGTDWSPGTLAALVAVASLRLELDLALRRLKGKTPARSAEKPAPEPPRAKSEAAELTPMPEKSAPSPDDSRRQDARRFARLVASEIRLYNEESVMLGRQHGDLSERLTEQLRQGEQTFRRRFGDLGDEGLILLREAFVQVLAGGDANALES